jgi:hypothetical protein
LNALPAQEKATLSCGLFGRQAGADDFVDQVVNHDGRT